MACDPQRNVVVQACAGAGKTWMLVSRILRALLASCADGAQPLRPQEILAITFTKKAAGEMRQRLHDWLQEFAQADDARLIQELKARGFKDDIGLQANRISREQLSNLYRAVLDSTRQVQIRTFHSWFAALLRSAPLAVLEQLGLPAQYELLEDDSEAVRHVWRRFYDALADDDALRHIYHEAVAAHGRFNVDKALSSALDKRVEFQLADTPGGAVASSIRAFAQVYPEFAGLDAPLELFAAGTAQHQQLAEVAKILGQYDGKIPQKFASEIEQALTDNQLPAALRALITLEGTPRKFSDKIPGIAQVRALQEQCVRINAAQLQHSAWQHQQRMAQLTRALIACYSALKRERAWVDMGDVERSALHLLSDPVLSGWVQQRLDAQTRHLLIDEFQDTNPLQWQALQAWLSGYAGAGGGGGGSTPSVFIVGDPKQSIYRFRRAEPQVFVAATDFVRDALGGVVLSCDHTRRNARGVLAAVNAVMQGAAQQGYEGFRPHTTESTQTGQVLRLPLVLREAADSQEEGAPWRDTLTMPREEAEEHIRSRECVQAAHWVAQQLTQGVPAGEVMVLSRKRDRLQRMRDALQALGIASQISEKTQLMAHCEVQDVVALVDALVSPSNNLALARALKSPLFGATDAQLMALAQAAKAQHGNWWQALQATLQAGSADASVAAPAGVDDAFNEDSSLSNSELLPRYSIGLEADFFHKTASDLLQYQQWFAALPPHDALAALYQHADVVARCMAAAPAPQRSAVAANLQALLAASLEVDGGRFLTPYAWVRALKSGSVRAPGSSAQLDGAVQLLTVHGAKGLEAHTVLMLDANAQAEKSRSMDVLIDWPAAHSAPTTFAFLASESAPPECVAQALEREQIARAREETNALYVAMTRAQHTLALSAHEVRSSDPNSPWQRFEALGEELVHSVALGGGLDGGLGVDDDGQVNGHAQTYLTSQANGVSLHASSEPFYIQKMPAGQWNIAGAAIKSIVTSVYTKAQDSDASRIGQAMHRLLELYTPGYDMAHAAASVGAQFQLDTAQAQQALSLAQAITQGEAAWVWDSAQIDWQANEVELVHSSELLRIDRLVRQRTSQDWWVLDYKSAPYPERQAQLRDQLKRYAQAVRDAHPGASVRAALITGEGRVVDIA